MCYSQKGVRPTVSGGKDPLLTEMGVITRINLISTNQNASVLVGVDSQLYGTATRNVS